MPETTKPKTPQPQEAIEHLHLLSFHYFRIPRRHWELQFLRLRQLGADAVHTVVPWSWHQPFVDWIDLVGATHPQRDMVGFLKLCDKLELPVVLCVGLHPTANLIANGTPLWLLQHNPEITRLDVNLKPVSDVAGAGRLPCVDHPDYQSYLKDWFGVLSQYLRPFQAPEGPIAALDLGVDRLLPDYNPHVRQVLWPIWLRQQYVDLADLNRAWDTGYSSYNQVPIPEPVSNDGTSATGIPQPGRDAGHFFQWARARNYQSQTTWLKQWGWQIPIFGAGHMSACSEREPQHICQVQEDLPTVSTDLVWAMDAPVTTDGHPESNFWAEKKHRWTRLRNGRTSQDLGMVVIPPDLLRPSSPEGSRVYRLSLDGHLFADDHARGTEDTSYTDCYLILKNDRAGLPSYVSSYLRHLLLVQSARLRRGAILGQELAALPAEDAHSTDDIMPNGISEDGTELFEARRSLAQAQQAVRKAATFLGEMEYLAGPLYQRSWSVPPKSIFPVGLTAEQRQHLAQLAADCDRLAVQFEQVADEVDTLVGQKVTLKRYSKVMAIIDHTIDAGLDGLRPHLATMRADLLQNKLPASAWLIHDQLVGLLNAVRDW